MTTLVRVDLTCALDSALGTGRGIAAEAVDALRGPLEAMPAWAAQESDAGRLAFLDLPLDEEAADAIAAWRQGVPAATDVVVAGIGGSALGARVFHALREATDVAPRLHVLDTVDPAAIEPLLGALDPESLVLLGVSRSGATLETAATFLLFEARMREALGDAAAARIAVVGADAEGPLQRHAAGRGYRRFPIPAGVGGRFSALSAAGLLPAACVGVEPRRLLAGAAQARSRCLQASLADNPALALAAVHHAALAAGRGVAVLWPYGERLRPLGPWWAQLLGESLGKGGPQGATGVTPVAASGPADQHSLLQLLMEGPDDKLVVFLAAEGPAGPAVPEAAGLPGAGQRLGAVLAAEREGTRFALAEAGRPSVTVRLRRADAACVGALLLTYEMATVYWARLLGVDPFGQPGVEAGKRAANARLTGEPADLAARMDAFAARPRTESS